MIDRPYSLAHRRILLLLAMAFLSLGTGCGKREPPPATDADAALTAAMPDYITRQAMMAVETVESTLGGMQDGGGYQSWTAEKAHGQIVPLLNAAMAPLPGEPRTPGPKFKYVDHAATAPWQVSVEVEGEALLVKAYGSDVQKPLYQKTIRVSTY